MWRPAAVWRLAAVALLLASTNLAEDDDGSAAAESEAEAEDEGSSEIDECYVCNSESEEECSSTDTDVLAQFSHPCAEHRPRGEKYAEATSIGCRKLNQQIEGDKRVIRECAWSGHNVHGYKRTGNKGVIIFYYQCDEEHCNGAAVSAASLVAALLIPLAVIGLCRF